MPQAICRMARYNIAAFVLWFFIFFILRFLKHTEGRLLTSITLGVVRQTIRILLASCVAMR